MTTKAHNQAMALAAAGVLSTGLLLAGCAQQSPTAGDNTDLQSDSSSSSESSNSSSTDAAQVSNEMNFPAASADTGTYADGTYTVSGTYGEHSASTMNASISIQDGKISSVEVTTESSSAISKKYGKDFVQNINAAVEGKDIRDLTVDTVAGASWTTEAFNTALVNVRGEASAAAAQS
ncbi:FMN-binding protein [Alloscardovia criceti]|uniref:FMN-binding protein n=1 Tax=Alloscardovia criceti TaxID=356828 RepID=UPI0003758B36|nr:FMN-binding protein [Alloscardovia criceti]